MIFQQFIIISDEKFNIRALGYDLLWLLLYSEMVLSIIFSILRAIFLINFFLGSIEWGTVDGACDQHQQGELDYFIYYVLTM